MIISCIHSYLFHHLPDHYEFTNDQLPAPLIAQLVERCTGIAEVMGSGIPFKPEFFQAVLVVFFCSFPVDSVRYQCSSAQPFYARKAISIYRHYRRRNQAS